MKTIILTLPMYKQKDEKQVFIGNDSSIKTSENGYVYAVNSYLEKNISAGEKIKVILLAKVDDPANTDSNIELFEREIKQISGIDYELCVVKSDYKEDVETHNKILLDLTEAISEGSEIICDYTFGPKDLTVVIFSALSFAEKFLDCEIERLLYVHTHFVNGKAEDTRLCDVSSLVYISAVTNAIDCNDTTEARNLLRTLLK